MSGAYVKPFKIREEIVMRLNEFDKVVLLVFLLVVVLSCLPVILFPSAFWGGHVDTKPIVDTTVKITDAFDSSVRQAHENQAVKKLYGEDTRGSK